MRPMKHLVAMVLVSLVLTAPSTADANCIGPAIDHTRGTVDRDDTVDVSGFAWGDACHDMGAPPSGEGVLGHPVNDIEIYLVQGDVEVLVATVDADESYEFNVAVPIPDTLKPGPVEVLARAEADLIESLAGPTEPLVISEVPPTGEAPDDIVTINRPPETDDGGDDGSAAPFFIGAALLAAGLAAGGVYLVRKKRS